MKRHWAIVTEEQLAGHHVESVGIKYYACNLLTNALHFNELADIKGELNFGSGMYLIAYEFLNEDYAYEALHAMLNGDSCEIEVKVAFVGKL